MTSRPPGSATEDQIPVADIDRYLSDLWDQMADKGEPGVPQARVRLLNLVLYGEDPSLPELAERLAGAVAARHPSRLVAVHLDSRRLGTEPVVAVALRCALDPAGRREVCGEVIVLTVPGEVRRYVPHLVMGLLLSDLPVALWWTGEPRPAEALFQSLAQEYAGLVVLDSAAGRNNAGALTALAEWAARPHHHALIADLAWARLLPWRQALAEFFDQPSVRPFVHEVSRVEITSRGDVQSADALLLAGWLASRLRWELVRIDRNPDLLNATYRAGSRRPEVCVRSAQREGVPDRMLGVRMFVGGDGKGHVFEVHRGHDANVVHGHQMPQGGTRSQRTAGRPELEEVDLVVGLLDQSGPDPVYAAAVAEAVELARGGGREGPRR